ncbi:MBL fold metallo-hydrolase [Paraliomyxa miuraensis]|uniref:MBL fold metallo-hydrolase n=1 Tax=Paraliomyxa miuraensis TaxID=376150 RepID=UPI00224D8771|nr:MBL fold metallo-hydrolase [Paraliomyxa miuraensis]MCX4241314.1 MBL fold metallo-hydrolase [Paraliomyxa miuraensis]
MIIDMIGHATVMVETVDRRILFDPVLFDTHHDGLFAAHPPRELEFERMPPPDTVVVSHQHLDHFDVRSLAMLPRAAEVLVPEDGLLRKTLAELGFARVHALPPLSRVSLGRTGIFTTPSQAPVVEIGFVVSDPGGTCWNAVDTVLTPETTGIVTRLFGTLDLMLAAWQPLLELEAVSAGAPGFPLRSYGGLLQRVMETNPRAVIPSSCGFAYRGASEWLNHRVFPVTRERFVHDLEQAHPPLRDRVLTLDPGDRVVLEDGVARRVVGGCPWVEGRPAPPDALDFWPVGEGPLLDAPPEWGNEAEVAAAVEHTLHSALPEAIAEHSGLATTLARWGARYQLQVVGGSPSHPRTWWFCCEFAEDGPRIHHRRDPLANVLARITASGLAGLALGRHDWDRVHLGGHYQAFDRLYRATPAGLARPEGVHPPEPLMLVFPARSTFAAMRSHEVRRWSTRPPE